MRYVTQLEKGSPLLADLATKVQKKLILDKFHPSFTPFSPHFRLFPNISDHQPPMSDLAQKTKDEMVDFVSFYRRFRWVLER
jgi:hypothetical protein